MTIPPTVAQTISRPRIENVEANEELAYVRELRHVRKCCFGTLNWLTGKLPQHSVYGEVTQSGNAFRVTIMVEMKEAQ